MPVESRQGPIYFHAVQNKDYRKNYDSIFRKKDKKTEKSEKKSKPDNKPLDNT